MSAMLMPRTLAIFDSFRPCLAASATGIDFPCRVDQAGKSNEEKSDMPPSGAHMRPVRPVRPAVRVHAPCVAHKAHSAASAM